MSNPNLASVSPGRPVLPREVLERVAAHGASGEKPHDDAQATITQTNLDSSISR